MRRTFRSRLWIENVIAVEVGNRQSFFIKSDGSLGNGGNHVWSIGKWNQDKQKHTREIEIAEWYRRVPLPIMECMFVKIDGSLWGMGTIMPGTWSQR